MLVELLAAAVVITYRVLVSFYYEGFLVGVIGLF